MIDRYCYHCRNKFHTRCVCLCPKCHRGVLVDEKDLLQYKEYREWDYRKFTASLCLVGLLILFVGSILFSFLFDWENSVVNTSIVVLGILTIISTFVYFFIKKKIKQYIKFKTYYKNWG